MNGEVRRRGHSQILSRYFSPGLRRVLRPRHSHFARAPIFAQTRAPTNRWILGKGGIPRASLGETRYCDSLRHARSFIRHEISSSNISKTVENTDSDGFWWNISKTVQGRIMKFYKLVEDNRPHQKPGNDVTSIFRSAAKCY